MHLYIYKLNGVKYFGLLQRLTVQAHNRYMPMSRYREYIDVSMLVCCSFHSYATMDLDVAAKFEFQMYSETLRMKEGTFSTSLTSNQPCAVLQGSILDSISRLFN